MPRPLVFGNGRLLVQIDSRGNIRDLSWPIGIWNHLSGRAIRIGVWADGLFDWQDGFGWSREMAYEAAPSGLVGREVHENAELGVRLSIREWIAMGEDRFVRELTVENLRAQPRDVRVFFAHDLRLMESDIGDCVLWHPVLAGLVHFKGHCAVLLRAEGADQYACGAADFGGHEGPWRDAEDGALSMKSIAQGTVDSSVGVDCDLEPHGTASFRYEIGFAESIEALEELSAPRSPAALDIRSAADALVDPRFHRAIIATQTSATGAILAANDSDIIGQNKAHYSYCWPRDGALVAEELLESQEGREGAERFLRYGLGLLADRPYLLQKYRADGAFGASWHPWTDPPPIQLDETASFVAFAAKCLEAGIPFTEDEIEKGIRRPVKFLLEYREDDLPKPSYDLWEERRGIYAYTAATVVHALRAVARVQPSRTLEDAADAMASAIRERLWNAEGYFQRGTDDAAVDASTLHIGLLGVLPIDDERVRSNAERVEDALWVRDGIGGLARYAGDYYHRVNERHPGNPWVITTLWLAQHAALAGDARRASELIAWVSHRAHPTGILPEQCHPDSGAPLSVSPLTWSHAEMLRTLRLLGRA